MSLHTLFLLKWLANYLQIKDSNIYALCLLQFQSMWRKHLDCGAKMWSAVFHTLVCPSTKNNTFDWLHTGCKMLQNTILIMFSQQHVFFRLSLAIAITDDESSMTPPESDFYIVD